MKKIVSSILIPTIAVTSSANAFTNKNRYHGVPDSLLTTEQALMKYHALSNEAAALKLDYLGVRKDIKYEVLALTDLVENLFLDKKSSQRFSENPRAYLKEYNLNFDNLEKEKVIQFLQLVVDSRFQKAVRKNDKSQIFALVQEYNIEEEYISNASREIYKDRLSSGDFEAALGNSDAQLVWIASAAAVIANVVVGANVIVGAILVLVAGVYVFVDGPGDPPEESAQGIGEEVLKLSKFKNLSLNDIDVKQNVNLIRKLAELTGQNEIALNAVEKAVKSEITAFVDAAYDIGFLTDYSQREIFISKAYESGLEAIIGVKNVSGMTKNE